MPEVPGLTSIANPSGAFGDTSQTPPYQDQQTLTLEGGSGGTIQEITSPDGSVIVENGSGPVTTLVVSPTDVGNGLTVKELWGPDPGTIATISTRLDASAITGVSDGALLATWNDSSGNSNNATQSSGAAKPTYYSSTAGKTINGLPAVWFSGSQWMATAAFAALNQPTTIFLVAQLSALPTGGNVETILDGIASADRQAFYANAAFFLANGGTQTQLLTASDTNLHVVTLQFNGNSSVFQVDSQVTAHAAGSNPLTGLTLGSAYNQTQKINGLICEVIVFPEALTAGQIAAIQTYLSNKWISTPTIVTPAIARNMFGTPWVPLVDYGASPTPGFDNQPAFAAAVAALIAEAAASNPGDPYWRTDAGCTVTINDATVDDASISGRDVGAYVYGPGIPPLTTVLSVNTGVSFVMSNEATAGGTVSLGIGYPIGVIEVDAGTFEIHSPCPNFGPFVTRAGRGRAQTRFAPTGFSGVAFSWMGQALGTSTLATELFYGATDYGHSMATSGRIDASCTTTRGSTTVLDASIGSGDVGAEVFGLGITDGTTIASVTPGVSFVLSYEAPYTQTGSLQIGGVRNVGILLQGVETAKAGRDSTISWFYNGPGAAGVMMTGPDSPEVLWNEKVDFDGLVLYGNYTQLYNVSGSLDYSDWDLIIYANSNTIDNILIDGGQPNYGRIKIRGNLYPSAGQISRVLSVIGTTVLGGGGSIADTEIDIAVELGSGGSSTYTIYLGPATGNAITGCYGRLKFGYGAGNQFLPLNVTPAAGLFEFTGLCFGDSVINPTPGTPLMVQVGQPWTMAAGISPGAFGVFSNANRIWMGTGVPSNANGSNGDYYFRQDGGVATHIYFKASGAWSALI